VFWVVCDLVLKKRVFKMFNKYAIEMRLCDQSVSKCHYMLIKVTVKLISY
jgi:hypothetical protein